MIASPGMTIRDAKASSRATGVAPGADPQVTVTATVSARAQPKRCSKALAADPRVPPDHPEETLLRAASSLRWSPARLLPSLATSP